MWNNKVIRIRYGHTWPIIKHVHPDGVVNLLRNSLLYHPYIDTTSLR